MFTSSIVNDVYMDNIKASSFMNAIVNKLGISLKPNTSLSGLPVRRIVRANAKDLYELEHSERKYVGRKSIHGSFLTDYSQKELPVFISDTFGTYAERMEKTFNSNLETPAEQSFRQITHWAFSDSLTDEMKHFLHKCSDMDDKTDVAIVSAQKRYLKTFVTLILCNCLPDSVYFSRSTKRSNNEFTVCCLMGVQYLKYLVDILYMQLKLLDNSSSSATFHILSNSLEFIISESKVIEKSNLHIVASDEDDDPDAETVTLCINSTYQFAVVPLDVFCGDYKTRKGKVTPGKRRCGWLNEIKQKRGKSVFLKADFRKMEKTLINSLNFSHPSCNIKGTVFFMRSFNLYPYNIPLVGPVSMGPLTLDVNSSFMFPIGNNVKHKSTKRSNAIYIRTVQICEAHLPVSDHNRLECSLVIFPVIQLAMAIQRLQYVVHTLPPVYKSIIQSVY